MPSKKKIDWNNFPDWQQEALASAKKVFDSPHFLPLPSKFDIHEYAIMEQFCYSTDDPKISNELSDLIRGSGAHRRLKDAIHRFGIEDDWYKYRDQALKEIAIEWLKSKEIAFSSTDKGDED